jgi:hypothetical protein
MDPLRRDVVEAGAVEVKDRRFLPTALESLVTGFEWLL